LVALRLTGQRKARPVAFALGAVIPVAAAIGYVLFAPVVVDHLALVCAALHEAAPCIDPDTEGV
jgi:hypothetical protein